MQHRVYFACLVLSLAIVTLFVEFNDVEEKGYYGDLDDEELGLKELIDAEKEEYACGKGPFEIIAKATSNIKQTAIAIIVVILLASILTYIVFLFGYIQQEISVTVKVIYVIGYTFMNWICGMASGICCYRCKNRNDERHANQSVAHHENSAEFTDEDQENYVYSHTGSEGALR
eukprot:115236_1